MKTMIGIQLPLPFNTVASNENKKQVQNISLPQSWKIENLGNLVDFKTGKLNSNAASDLGKYPFFTCSQETLKIDNYAFDLEAILLSGNNARGIYSVKYYQGKFNAYQRTYIITIKDVKSVSYGFLLHALTIKLEHLRTISIGTSTKYLTLGMLQNLEIVLPPIDEQRKIAVVLSLVQNAIAQQDQLITLTSELKKKLMQKIFTEGTHWDVVPLKKTGEVIYGIQASVANNIEPLGTKILTNKNINLNGEFNFEKQNYFEITTERHRKTILKKGDILFNWRSGSKEHVGKTAYFDLEGEYTHSSFILRIRPYPTVNGRYIFHYLTWLRESNYFVKLQSYAINAKFNKSAVDALPTLLPTPEEQDNIAFLLDFLSEKVNQHRAKRNTLNDLFRTLLHQLMTVQIRVDDLNLSALNVESQGGEE